MNAQQAWQQLSNVPVNADGETEAQFLGFPIGTERLAIWAWIEDEYDVSVHDLMHQTNQRGAK